MNITYPLMADSIHPDKIPASAVAAAALYINGDWPATAAQIRRFKGHVLISVLAGRPDFARLARVLDVESGDASPADVPGWIDARRAFGHDDATIYANRDNLQACLSAANGRPCRIWLATLDGTEFGPHDGFWAVQYQPATPGHDYDLSVVYGVPDFTHPHAAPAILAAVA